MQQEPWNEAQQERLELLRARVSELGRQLGALAMSWRSGPLSLHMNLAVPLTSDTHHATVLRSQNKLLVEVGDLNSNNNNKLAFHHPKKLALGGEHKTSASFILITTVKRFINIFHIFNFQEVSRKNEKINTLEREKSALVRELFLQRSRIKMLDNFN